MVKGAEAKVGHDTECGTWGQEGMHRDWDQADLPNQTWLDEKNVNVMIANDILLYS